MRPSAFVASLPDVDISLLPPHEKQCNICMEPLRKDSSLGFYVRYNLRSRSIPVAPKYSSEEAVRLPCGHLFGRDCINAWLSTNNACPMCRHPILPPPLLPKIVPDGSSLAADLDYLMIHSHHLPSLSPPATTENPLVIRVRQRCSEALLQGFDSRAWREIWNELLEAHRRFQRSSFLTLTGFANFWWRAIPPEVLDDVDGAGAEVLEWVQLFFMFESGLEGWDEEEGGEHE